MNPRVDAVWRTVEALRRDEAALRAAVMRTAGGSDDAARWSVRHTLARYTPDALTARCDARWEGRAVRVVLAATVPLAPLRAIVLPLLQCARAVWVKPSRRQPEVARRVVDALAAQGLPVHLGEGAAQGVIAYGRDETLDLLAAQTPPDVAFEGHGHGFGAVVLTAWEDETAQAVARDVAAYDQHGCLSPQVVLCAHDAPGLARALHHALADLETRWPRAPMDAGVGAGVWQWLGVQAALGATVHRGAGHAVTLWDRAVMQASPGARNVAVVPVHDLDAARALLTPHARVLSNVGTDAPHDPRWRPEGFAGRVSAVGAMQDPPLDGPEDPRPPRPLRVP
ncbi:MAG: acyl-CoA reductase [Polyangiales bacterium]